MGMSLRDNPDATVPAGPPTQPPRGDIRKKQLPGHSFPLQSLCPQPPVEVKQPYS